jgi:glutamyl-Q tRNA(Asp) synthetase
LKPYRGRFAPSPTGPLHAGSLVAALASWLDAKAHGGQWLVRIEDIDTPRCVPGADQYILQQLQACGLIPDEPVVWQSTRSSAYEQALAQLHNQGWAYACACSRKTIADYWAAHGSVMQRHAELPYPGTCRPAQTQPDHTPNPQAATQQHVAWRLDMARVMEAHHLPCPTRWLDRRLGGQQQDVQAHVGDFVLQRADGLWAYQLAVVVDDAWQGITHVVRGQDLADNTPRQRLLQIALGLPTVAYLHTPLVLSAQGDKLSKQTGAAALDVATPEQAMQALSHAALALGLPPHTGPVHEALASWVASWVTAWHTLYGQPTNP